MSSCEFYILYKGLGDLELSQVAKNMFFKSVLAAGAGRRFGVPATSSNVWLLQGLLFSTKPFYCCSKFIFSVNMLGF